MVTATDKGFSIRADLVNQVNKTADEKVFLPAPKKNRALNKKSALRRFLKRLYIFLLTAFGL